MFKQSNRMYLILVMVIALVFMREVNAEEVVKNIDTSPSKHLLAHENIEYNINSLILLGQKEVQTSFRGFVIHDREIRELKDKEILTLGLSFLAVFVSLAAMVITIGIKRKG